MPFHCPECSQLETLAIVHSLDFPPDSRSDEISLQLVECGQCGFKGLAVYQESRRGAWDSESWEHDGWRIPAEDWDRLAKLMLACPQPHQTGCGCFAHQELGRLDSNGQWAGLESIRLLDGFALLI